MAIFVEALLYYSFERNRSRWVECQGGRAQQGYLRIAARQSGFSLEASGTTANARGVGDAQVRDSSQLARYSAASDQLSSLRRSYLVESEDDPLYSTSVRFLRSRGWGHCHRR
ncbi:MAG TPA: hypothetical protein VFE62_02760, partial [Gemmataceae bacterium]|nr:hypothetical protein [Gemmataceae bacterium]